jgi:hypothetical protein
MTIDITHVIIGLRVLRRRLDKTPPELLAFQLDGFIEDLESLAEHGDALVKMMGELEGSEDKRCAGRALQSFMNRLQEHFVRREDLPPGRGQMLHDVIYRLYDEAKHVRRYG